MLTRSSTGYVLRTDSDDDGRTWSEMYSSGLYNNNSGLDALKLSSGQWVVVHNPVNRNWVQTEVESRQNLIADRLAGPANTPGSVSL